jgi:hypothetical protein
VAIPRVKVNTAPFADPLPRRQVDLEEVAAVAGGGGVVDENVDAAEFFGGALDHVLNRMLGGHVRLCEDRPPTIGGEIAAGALTVVRVDLGHDHRGAFQGKAPGDSTSDAASAAGDDGDPVFQLHLIFLSRLTS